ncbi:rhodanese-like domain-containing protein [Aquibacillus rhizosphaerae]|uniref:Sulfurtransferase n=1 Tax=Aquibacillus rhizosphaerae TaxID=3051431 RepID=A0ABT7L3J9_9BACI|nr:sulfurtransferase [Aquibacillus sp. LR5S19]MDL4840433.1 sulfurtransferase [Aquibacillus sp. LR5S19]
MVIGITAFFVSIILYLMYLRYVPIKGIPCIDVSSNQMDQISLKLDIRDYNSSAKQEVEGSIVMPVAYLKRYYKEIPSKELVVIASDRTEKNLGIRFLHNKGFKVIGYTLTSCKCE